MEKNEIWCNTKSDLVVCVDFGGKVIHTCPIHQMKQAWISFGSVW